MTPTLIGMTAAGFVALGLLLLGGRRRRAATLAVVALAVVGYALGSASPAVAQEKVGEKEILALIDQLEDAEKADEAVAALKKIGKPAVPHLIGEALEGKSIIKRGWCIVVMSEIGGSDVKKRLTELYQDGKQPKLVRTWAAAAVVYQCETSEQLLAMAPLINQFPALGRPIGMRLVDALGKKGGAKVEDIINITLQVRQLQQPLAPAILAFGSDELVKVMTSSKNTNVARQATAYLGTIAQKDRTGVAKAVIEAYKFNPKAKKVPWNTALWVPGINWGKDHGRDLVGNLIRWYLWCDLNNQTQNQRQIQNNIRGVGLAQQVGYQSVFQGNPPKVEQWLLSWGKLVGKKEIEALLAEQGVADNARFKNVLSQL